METPTAPSYDGRGLVNLIAEIEGRHGGSPLHAGLDPDLASLLTTTSTTVLVVFDGLGSHQLTHPFAADLAAADRGPLDAPFPTTTTVSLTTIATGRTPTEHGVVGYTLVDPRYPAAVNTIHLRSVFGDDLGIDPETFVGGDRVWERLAAAGVESVVVQPGNFATSPLTKMLYRGARFEAYHHPDEAIDVTVDVARHPARVVLLYLPYVDVAAHVSGQRSAPYSEALRVANMVWARLANALPDDVTLIGTADHGHVDIGEADKYRIPKVGGSTAIAGDPRVLFVYEPGGDRSLALPATDHAVENVAHLWGPGTPAGDFERRLPRRVIIMNDGLAAYTPAMNDRLVGHHGGLTPAELNVPLLLR